MNRTKEIRCKYILHTAAPSVTEERGDTEETTQIAKNRSENRHFGEMWASDGPNWWRKNWKMADMLLIVCGCYKTSQSVPLLASWGVNRGREGKARWRSDITSDSSKLGVGFHQACYTDGSSNTLLQCGTAKLPHRSDPPFPDLSISEGQDGPAGFIAFQSSYHGWPPTETRGKNRKVCEREIGIDLITYSAVSRFGCAQQLNTLKYNVRRRALVWVECLWNKNINEEGKQHARLLQTDGM